jgi:Ca2+-binding RTX toxin-like protein
MAVYFGGDRNDVLEGNDGFLGLAPQNDTFYGNDGDDIIRGYGGNDIAYGGNGHDGIYGGEGHDALYGDAGHDLLNGDAGDDYLDGGDGNDTIYGGWDGVFGLAPGADTLVGGNGYDYLYGEGGNDSLYGDGGSDYLNGGTGRDYLTGGSGSDTFALRAAGFGVDDNFNRLFGGTADVITDWTSSDWIEVTGNSSQYSLGTGNFNVGSTAYDTGIFRYGELIGIVQDSTDVIMSRDFKYV